MKRVTVSNFGLEKFQCCECTGHSGLIIINWNKESFTFFVTLNGRMYNAAIVSSVNPASILKMNFWCTLTCTLPPVGGHYNSQHTSYYRLLISLYRVLNIHKSSTTHWSFKVKPVDISLQMQGWCRVINLCVFLSIICKFVLSTIPAAYPTTATTLQLIAWTIFPPFSLDLNIFCKLQRYSFSILLFILVCLISSPSSTLRYL